jgi:hypothetical protein
MSRSSERRAQVEPLAALVAVAILGIGLGLYAGTVETATPPDRERTTAEAALVAVVSELRTGSVVVPGRVEDTGAVAPEGYRMQVSVRAADRDWRDGPRPPTEAQTATRTLPVRVGPEAVVPGRLRVEVWPWTAA